MKYDPSFYRKEFESMDPEKTYSAMQATSFIASLCGLSDDEDDRDRKMHILETCIYTILHWNFPRELEKADGIDNSGNKSHPAYFGDRWNSVFTTPMVVKDSQNLKKHKKPKKKNLAEFYKRVSLSAAITYTLISGEKPKDSILPLKCKNCRCWDRFEVFTVELEKGNVLFQCGNCCFIEDYFDNPYDPILKISEEKLSKKLMITMAFAILTLLIISVLL